VITVTVSLTMSTMVLILLLELMYQISSQQLTHCICMYDELSSSLSLHQCELFYMARNYRKNNMTQWKITRNLSVRRKLSDHEMSGL